MRNALISDEFLHKTRLTPYEKAALKADTDLDDECLECLERKGEWLSLLVVKKCRIDNLLWANITPSRLFSWGVRKPSDLRAFNVDSTTLVLYPEFTKDCVEFYGRDDMHTTFLATAGDAVMVSNSEAARHMNLLLSDLLELARGDPFTAIEVLRQYPEEMLWTLPLQSLLDCGITAADMAALGVPLDALLHRWNPSPAQLHLLRCL